MLLLLAQAPAPAATPAPPVSLGTALITGGALLLGVLITNYLQNKREARTFERQLTLYANQASDQREKDAADREEQRRRDRELWEREDRHRFASQRRELFGKLLAEVGTFLDGANLMFVAIDRNPPVQLDEQQKEQLIADNIAKADHHLRLISEYFGQVEISELDEDLVERVREIVAACYALMPAIAKDNDPESAETIFEGMPLLRSSLVKAMKRNLT